MGQTPPLETLIEAANLAVYFSKAKNESKIQVDYTLKKYVKKPRNAKPGMVIYSQEKNLFIALNQRLINNIFSRKFD
jgi:predicted ribosome quality control (RQC) complex YloA/Tae2 family protein